MVTLVVIVHLIVVILLLDVVVLLIIVIILLQSSSLVLFFLWSSFIYSMPALLLTFPPKKLSLIFTFSTALEGRRDSATLFSANFFVYRKRLFLCFHRAQFFPVPNVIFLVCLPCFLRLSLYMGSPSSMVRCCRCCRIYRYFFQCFVTDTGTLCYLSFSLCL